MKTQRLNSIYLIKLDIILIIFIGLTKKMWAQYFKTESNLIGEIL
jgi:hypothetical protein